MKMIIGQSVIERLLYIILLLAFLGAFTYGYAEHEATNRLSARVNFFQNQLATENQALQQNKALSQQIKVSTDAINRHMDCLVTLFTNPNRLNLTITDIHSCTITQTSAPVGSTNGVTKSG